MHNRNNPRALDDPTFVLPNEHMVAPCKPPDKPHTSLVCTYAGELTLESGSDIVCLRKVKVLGHVHLMEHREQPLLLDEVVDRVLESYRDHVRAL